VTATSVSAILGWVEKSHARAAALLFVISLALFVPGFTSLPPMDRDEPRFAQASRQMLETGDFVDIRFQTEARHKKPVGIYWLQTAVVSGAEALGIPDARQTIWIYRLPSLAGAILAVLMTYAAAIVLTTRRAAFIAAALFAATILIGVEARLAKTDAVQTATIVAAMAALARVWMTREDPKATLGWGWWSVFWLSIGAGVLVKGPITPLVVALAAVVLSLADGSARWLGRLRPLRGMIVVLVMAAPWFLAIMLKSGGAFFEEAVGQDMLGKVAAGQESHGAPPGTYLAAFFGTAWPMAPFVLLAIPFAWRQRWRDEVLFVLAWAVPMWLVFELVPTKLPHYVLPLYPALAILVAVAAERQSLAVSGRLPRIAMGLLPLLVVALAGVAAGAIWVLDSAIPFVALPIFTLAAVAAVIAWRFVFAGKFASAVLTAVVASVLVSVAAYGWSVPLLRSVALSPRLAAAARAMDCPVEGFATVGYREPSLVFLTRTDLEMTDGAGAARFLREGQCRVAFVESRQEAAFLAGMGTDVQPRLLSRVRGLNLNGGRRLDIGVYRGP
jgi:4-amino-4-deoxy-L-arabinose transferase-like glycosyltransferase